MLLPLLVTLFAPGAPGTVGAAALPRASEAANRRTSMKGAADSGPARFVLTDTPPVFAPPAAPRLLPQASSLHLDLHAQEERDAADLIAAINTERTERGLGPLAEDALLNTAARAHSDEMDRLGYFDHSSPVASRRTPLDRYLGALRAWGEAQPDSALVGENLFYASVSDSVYTIAYAHARLMDSPGHRANILEPRFTKIGVGLCRDAEGRCWVTEMFLRD